MNPLMLVNYTIFAVLLSLFSLEVGAALLSIIKYRHYDKKVATYIAPIWEITGTFSIFFIVNLVATYPGLVPVLDLYIAPVFVGAVSLVVRDAFLGYSEFAEPQNARKEAIVYSACTLLLMLMVTLVLASAMSGMGINLSTSTVSLLGLVNPFSIALLVSVLLFVSFCTMVFYEVRNVRLLFITIMLSVVIGYFAVSFYVPYVIANMQARAYLLMPALILFVMIAVLYVKKSAKARFLVLPFLFFSAMALELLTYPSLMNGAVQLSNFLTPLVAQGYVLAITAAGSLFLAVALSYFVYVHHLHKKNPRVVY